MTADDIIKLGTGLYSSPRQLPDGTWCCIGQQLYTWSLMVGIDAGGYHHRFCFEHRAEAETALAKMQSATDEPTGYLARKPSSPPPARRRK